MRYNSHTRSHSLNQLKRAFGIFGVLGLLAATAHADGLSVQGVHVVPHVQSKEMRYRRDPDFSLGARVEEHVVLQLQALLQRQLRRRHLLPHLPWARRRLRPRGLLRRAGLPGTGRMHLWRAGHVRAKRLILLLLRT